MRSFSSTMPPGSTQRHCIPDTLQVLIDAKASKDDQNDKDLALAGAAAEGNIASVHSLLAYGANPNADLSKFTQLERDFASPSTPVVGTPFWHAVS